jgi:hypothetical protein
VLLIWDASLFFFKELLSMKKVARVLLSAIQEIVYMIGKSPFWLIALLDLCLRLFVVRPLGALLALAVGIVWISHNWNGILLLLMKLRSRLTTWASSYKGKCPWFDSTGRAEIIELVDWLSAQGVSYCNLADEMQLPEQSQWYAISRGLNEAGIFTQISGDAFYLTWRLPRKAAQSDPEAA